MRIEQIGLRLVDRPLVHHVETNVGRVDRRAFVVIGLAGDGISGLGECVAGDDPYDSAETLAVDTNRLEAATRRRATLRA